MNVWCNRARAEGTKGRDALCRVCVEYDAFVDNIVYGWGNSPIQLRLVEDRLG